MPIMPSTTRSDNPPSYAEAMSSWNPPPNAPLPPNDSPPSYAQATGTQPSTSNSRAPSEPATNLPTNRSANSVTSRLATLGMFILSKV